MHRICAIAGFSGVLLGVAMVAHGQEPAPVVAASAETELLLRLMASGGLPAVLGVGFFYVTRAVANQVDSLMKKFFEGLNRWEPTVTVRLADDEATELIRLRQEVIDLRASKEAR